MPIAISNGLRGRPIAKRTGLNVTSQSWPGSGRRSKCRVRAAQCGAVGSDRLCGKYAENSLLAVRGPRRRESVAALVPAREVGPDVDRCLQAETVSFRMFDRL